MGDHETYPIFYYISVVLYSADNGGRGIVELFSYVRRFFLGTWK